MNDWGGLRTAVVIAVWVTVAGGLTMALTWLAKGGGRAIGPEDELLAQSGVHVERRGRPFTAFSSAQVGIHGLLGLMTASLLTYAAARADDRPAGYLGVLVAIALTAIPGTLMVHSWRSGRRPAIDGSAGGGRGPKVEDGIPTLIVLAHGAAAATVVALLVVLLFVE